MTKPTFFLFCVVGVAAGAISYGIGSIWGFAAQMIWLGVALVAGVFVGIWAAERGL